MNWRFARMLMSISIAVLLVPALVGSIGCGGSEAGGGWYVSMMKRLPKDADTYNFTDVAELRSDGDLHGAYASAEHSIEDNFGQCGISASDVDRMARGSRVSLLEGRFNVGEIKKSLDDHNYFQEGDAYKGVEIWQGYGAIGLVSASCVVSGRDAGSVEECIDVIKGDKESFYDIEDIRDVVGILPGGVKVYLYSKYDEYKGVEASGYSAVKKNTQTGRVAAAYLCEDEAAAQRLKGTTQDFYEEESYTSIQVTQDGKHVVVTAEKDLEDIF